MKNAIGQEKWKTLKRRKEDRTLLIEFAGFLHQNYVATKVGHLWKYKSHDDVCKTTEEVYEAFMLKNELASQG